MISDPGTTINSNRNRMFALAETEGTPVHNSFAHSQFTHLDLIHEYTQT